MGIDIYMRWPKQTEEEQKAQYTGFDTTAGKVGYLREAYHGAPYATRILCPEAFEAEDAEAKIPAATLRKRLPAVIQTHIERQKTLYQRTVTPEDDSAKSFEDFVALAEAKEKEIGEPVLIYASY